MDSKIVMLLIGIVAIGMFALPSTLAMYSGQHSFVSGANVDCNKCHGTGDLIRQELDAGDMHVGKPCKACHGFTGTDIIGLNPDDGTVGHAASVEVTCMGCHATIAPTDTDSVIVTDELIAGAHKTYYEGTVDKDDACIHCHTNAAVDGNIVINNVQANLSLANYNY